mmetsp:Transcript_9657/g.15327  ORF Transcript_9657/g.15327 Transcript_9657/m.15327 type:complete len:80 (-) Transcript_9657:23-262(-)
MPLPYTSVQVSLAVNGPTEPSATELEEELAYPLAVTVAAMTAPTRARAMSFAVNLCIVTSAVALTSVSVVALTSASAVA